VVDAVGIGIVALAAGASVTVMGNDVGASTGGAFDFGLGARVRNETTANTIAAAIIASEAPDARTIGAQARDRGAGRAAKKSVRTSSVALAGYLSPPSVSRVFSMVNRRRHGRLRWDEKSSNRRRDPDVQWAG
jgi:hypothetical protein